MPVFCFVASVRALTPSVRALRASALPGSFSCCLRSAESLVRALTKRVAFSTGSFRFTRLGKADNKVLSAARS